MDLKNRIPCAIMNQGKSMLIDKTSILSQNLGHYQLVRMHDFILTIPTGSMLSFCIKID